MTIQEAVKKGFLNLTEEEAAMTLDALFDNDDPQSRLDNGVELLTTFMAEEKIPFVLDLVAIILDANDELEGDQEGEHDHDHDHTHEH
jgi:hypothetical protein